MKFYYNKGCPRNFVKQIQEGIPRQENRPNKGNRERSGSVSGRVLESRPRGRGFKPHLRHWVVVFEQHTFILTQYWFNTGRPVPV